MHLLATRCFGYPKYEWAEEAIRQNQGRKVSQGPLSSGKQQQPPEIPELVTVSRWRVQQETQHAMLILFLMFFPYISFTVQTQRQDAELNESLVRPCVAILMNYTKQSSTRAMDAIHIHAEHWLMALQILLNI